MTRASSSATPAKAAAQYFACMRADGASVHAVDVFVVEAGRIRSLSYFICAHS